MHRLVSVSKVGGKERSFPSCPRELKEASGMEEGT